MADISARIGQSHRLLRADEGRGRKVSRPLLFPGVVQPSRQTKQQPITRKKKGSPNKVIAPSDTKVVAPKNAVYEALKQPQLVTEVQATETDQISRRISIRFPDINVQIPVVKKEDNPMTLYRIVPDRRISNNQNRKFWRLIHELMELDHRLRNRISRDGWCFSYHMRDTVWFDMVARCEEIKTEVDGEVKTEQLRKLDFYMAVPTKFANAFKQKMIDRNSQITIEEVDFSAVAVPEGSEIMEYRFKRHDIFSLEAKDNEQQTPISSLMNTVLDLHGNDFMRFSVCLERMDRKHWRKLADYAWRQLDKKRVPARARLDFGLLLRNIGDIGRHVALEVKSVLEDTLQAFQNAFFKSGGTLAKSERKKASHAEYERLFANGELAPESKKKLFDMPYKTKIRLAVRSDDRARVHMLQQGITNALQEMNGDNQLQPHKVRVNIRGKVIKEMNTFQTFIRDRDPNVMSAKEIGKLNQYPTAELQERFSDILESKRKIEVDIPKCFRDSSGIFVGTSEVRGEKIDIFIPTKSMDKTMTARGFVGSPRQGKDQALINLIVESKRKHGIGAVIPDWIDERNKDKDGHQRGLSDAVRDSLPPEDVIDIECTNYDWAVYLGLSNVIKAFKNSRIAADEISKIITEFLMGKDSGDLHTTREHLRDSAKVCYGDWVDIKRLFTDPAFREKKIEEMEQTSIGDVDLWRVFHEDLSDGQRSQIFTPINVRLGEIMNDEALKPILCQRPNDDADLAQWIKDGKVVIIRMKFNPRTAKIFARYIMMVVYLIKRQLDGHGAPTWLPINEPHQVETPEFTEFLNRILVEGPKMKLAPVVAFHHLGKGHLSKELIDTLSSANISWHMFYNSNLQTYEKLQSHIEPTFTPKEAMRTTAQFHFIAAGWRDNSGTVQPPFMLNAPDRVKDRWGAQDNSFLTKRHSRQFGRPIDEVLADFRERNKRPRRNFEQHEEQHPYDEPAAVGETEQTSKSRKKVPKHVFAKK